MSVLLGIILFLAIAGFIFYLVSAYNQIQRLAIISTEGLSSVKVCLQKRYDLIPNLVQCVKGYASHEKSIFEEIAVSRSQAISASSMNEVSKANADLSLGLNKLLSIVEAYPQLKADELFNSLQKSLSEVENELVNARNYYNGCVRNFNQAIMIFPNVIIASQLNMKPKDFFEISEGVQENVKVSF